MDVHNQHSNHEHLIRSFKQDQVVVIMVPLPAQGHLNQLLQLSCLISSCNIPVHYVGWATHILQAKQRFNGTNYLNNNIAKIHFHEFPTPPFLSPPPNPNATNKFPQHLIPCFEASLQLRQPVAQLLHQLSPTTTRIVVIHDTLMDVVVQDSASVSNAKSYAFLPTSAFSSLFYQWELLGKPFPPEEPEELPSIEGCHTSEFLNFAAPQSDFMKFSAGSIYNTCRFIEGTYIDQLRQIGSSNKQWAIGPLNSVTISKSKNSHSKHESLEWLDKQAQDLRYLFLSEQQLQWHMNRSKSLQWGDDVERAELPEGYEERVKKVGIVVRDWAPQLEILGHPSTGGFMSHCGWNSCMESISMGVPIAAWPMHCDQPKNAFTLTNILKVGMVLNQWTRREEQVTSSAIAKAVKTLMATKEGEETRKRAEELGGVVQQSVKEGGASRMELDSFIAHITR
ncbi:hypothetical protein TEA_008517 [Camellia sinensis var. sinensis]|uniref:Glycosyltransferase n=1 Tax=Camellia sinensis var. sinensis TaxID=542762 RepID=A0A4S4EM86_CAMSN|nr:hypothetical protein TEA_008517 [Camellia sinensis var. sinensis]